MEYILKRAKIKRLSIRINSSGEVIVNAPRNISKDIIDDFVISKNKWIKKQLKSIEELHNKRSQYDFENYVYIYNTPIKFDGNKIDFYKSAFDNDIKKIVEEMSLQLNLQFKNLRTMNSVRIWGSLDYYKNMSLNWKIIILPLDIIKYIILHELCHGIEFNHSKKFWALVEQFVPNYKQYRRELKNYAFLLRTKVV